MLNQIAGKTLCHCQIDASGTVFKLLANVGSPEKTKHGKTASQSMGDAAQARTIMLNTRLLQFIHCRSMKADNILDARQMADKNPVDFVIFDSRDVTVVFHHVHGVMPACFKTGKKV